MQIKYSLINKPEDSENYIYFSKSYQKIFSRIYDSKSKYIKLEKNGKKAFLPLLIRELGFKNFEAFSTYGYGGIFGENFNLSNEDIQYFKEYLSNLNIHSLFIRHSPFTDNHFRFPEEIIEANRKTYQCDLSNYPNFESFKINLKQKIRASINHAEKYSFYPKVVCNPLEENYLKEFYKIYLSRMMEINSSKFYYFDLKLFEDHIINLCDKCQLIVIKNKLNKIVSGALFLCDQKKKIVHYHLSASTKEALDNQCNDLMISYANFHFGKLGFKVMHLGGGMKFNESDGLSRFKKKYSDFKKTFYITKIICNSKVYFDSREKLVSKIKNNLFLIGDSII